MKDGDNRRDKSEMGGTGYLERLFAWEGYAEPRTVQGVTAADTAGFGHRTDRIHGIVQEKGYGRSWSNDILIMRCTNDDRRIDF